MQGTTEFHHQIADAFFPQADAVFDNATALHTAVDMLDPPPPLVESLVGPLLLQGQLRTAWLLRRHQDLSLGERERQEAHILHQPTPGRQWVGGGLREAQIMDTAAVGVAQKEDHEQGMHKQHICYRVILFLAALTRFLCNRVLGADDPPFGPVMGKRGDAGAVAGPATTDGGASSSGETIVAALASETPSRCARAIRERAGASPRVRKAASKAGKRTWIH